MKKVSVRRYVRRHAEGDPDLEKIVKRARKDERRGQRGLIGMVVGPEELEVLQKKLHPRRFPGMDPLMAAIVAYIVDLHDITEPEIDSMVITSDGFILASKTDDVGHNMFLGYASDLERNWADLLEAADLTLEERANAQRLFSVKVPMAGMGVDE